MQQNSYRIVSDRPEDVIVGNIRVIESQNPSMIHFVKDLPNLCSLAGLMGAMLGIYHSILGNFSFAIIGIIWAILFDWADGIIARKLKNRSDNHKAFGPQLDSLIDMVSFGIFPAVFLLSYGKFNPWFFPGAFLLIATSAIRLSYFNVFGLVDKDTYKGLALDNNMILLSFLFLFERLIERSVFAVILYIFLMGMMLLNLASIKTPKFAGKWFYVLIAYSVVMTIIYLLFP